MSIADGRADGMPSTRRLFLVGRRRKINPSASMLSAIPYCWQLGIVPYHHLGLFHKVERPSLPRDGRFIGWHNCARAAAAIIPPFLPSSLLAIRASVSISIQWSAAYFTAESPKAPSLLRSVLRPSLLPAFSSSYSGPALSLNAITNASP